MRAPRSFYLGPSGLLLASFGGLIFLGSGLLYLPVMQGASPVSYLDCLFTSTSAVCVTGLITVDTATAWSAWGQALILVLLQLGGLGIMTFSVAMMYLAGRDPGLVGSMAVRGSLGRVPAREIGRFAGGIVIYTLVLEGLGALVLFLRFVSDYSPLRALALGVFHSVSAFCNAGFSLFSRNLEAYPHDPVVNLTVMSLITLGGLGFLVLKELADRLSLPRGQRRRRLSLHSRLVLTTSGMLVVGGSALIWLLEYLEGGGAGNDFWPSLFNAVTARTAGFNTIPLDQMANASLLVIMFLMFVGASPGSTGGGVKTTALATLYAVVRGRLRGLPGAAVQGRSIGDKQVGEALTLVMTSMLVVMLAILLLVIFEEGSVAAGHRRGHVFTLAFEAVSAFGTVGLSMGATPTLSPVGKVIIMCLMFLGRLGPLTFIYALVKRARTPRLSPAQERIMLG